MASDPALKTLMYFLSVAIIVAFVIGGSWGFWVMFAAWNLGSTKDWAQIVIIATSVFWLCIGGLLWLVPSRRRKS